MRSLSVITASVLVLVSGYVSSARAGAVAAPAALAPAAGWVKVQGQTIVLNAMVSMPKTNVTMHVGPALAAGWNAPEGFDVVTVAFRLKGADKPAAVYVLSPWQRMWWIGTGVEPPNVISVNRYSVVIRRVAGQDQSPAGLKVAKQADKLMRDILSVSACGRGTQIGHSPWASPLAAGPAAIKPKPVFRFRRYYVWFDYPAVKPGKPFSADETPWDHLAANRMLLLTRSKADPKAPEVVVRYDLYPPAKIIRTRRRPPMPDEQRLAPGTDLAAASAKMDRGLQKVFGQTATAVVKLQDPSDNKARKAILTQSLPELKTVIFAYPGHTGPAHSAGEAAFEKARDRLRRLIFEGQLDCCETGSWQVGPLLYRPGLLDKLRNLPPATLADLPGLLDAFGKYQALANDKPGMTPTMVGRYMPSGPELLLAEVGDRIRTVASRGLRGNHREILEKKLKGKKTLQYNGFRLWIEDPGGKHIRQATTPVKITIVLDAYDRPDPPHVGSRRPR